MGLTRRQFIPRMVALAIPLIVSLIVPYPLITQSSKPHKIVRLKQRTVVGPSRYLPVKRTDSIIEYNKGNLVTVTYEPQESSYIKGGVMFELGLGGAIGQFDEQNSHQNNGNKLLIAPAQRGFYTTSYHHPSTGIKKISDGNFTLENCANTHYAVYSILNEKFQKDLFGMGHSFGGYNLMRSSKEKEISYAAVSLLNPMLSFKDVYKEHKYGNLLMNLIKILKFDPEWLRNWIAARIIDHINEINGNKPTGGKKIGDLWIKEPYQLLKRSLEAPALYDIIKEFDMPLLVQQVVNDGNLFVGPMDEGRYISLRDKWQSIVKDKKKLELIIIGELNKEEGPNHEFVKKGIMFAHPKFEEAMDRTYDFFMKNKSYF